MRKFDDFPPVLLNVWPDPEEQFRRDLEFQAQIDHEKELRLDLEIRAELDRRFQETEDSIRRCAEEHRQAELDLAINTRLAAQDAERQFQLDTQRRHEQERDRELHASLKRWQQHNEGLNAIRDLKKGR